MKQLFTKALNEMLEDAGTGIKLVNTVQPNPSYPISHVVDTKTKSNNSDGGSERMIELDVRFTDNVKDTARVSALADTFMKAVHHKIAEIKSKLPDTNVLYIGVVESDEEEVLTEKNAFATKDVIVKITYFVD